MRVLVTGSRNYPDPKHVHTVLNLLYIHVNPGEVFTVVHGDCPTGADKFARSWCDTRAGHPDVIEERHPADWEKHGKKAGPLRNIYMVDLGADMVIAFPYGESRGTRHCMQAAEAAGIPVHILGSEKSETGL